MKGLIYKDLLYLKSSYKQLLITFIIVIFLCFYKNYLDIVLIGLPCLFSMIIIGSMQIEQENLMHIYISISSLKLEKVVLSKYISYFILTLIGIMISVLLCLLVNVIGNNQSNSFTDMMGISIGSGFSFIFGSTIIPIYYMFKDKKIDTLLSYSMIAIAVFIVIVLSLLKNLNGSMFMNNLDFVSYVFSFISVLIYVCSFCITLIIIRYEGLV